MKDEIPIILLIIFILFVMYVINPVDFPPEGMKNSLRFLFKNFSTITLIVLVMLIVLIVMVLTQKKMGNELGDMIDEVKKRSATISFVTPKLKNNKKKKEFEFPERLPSDKEIRQNLGVQNQDETQENDNYGMENDSNEIKEAGVKEAMFLLENTKKNCMDNMNFDAKNLCEDSTCCNNFAVKDNLVNSRKQFQFKDIAFGNSIAQLSDMDYFRKKFKNTV